MKKFILTLMLLAGLQLGTNYVHAQSQSSPPGPPSNHGTTTDQSPGGGGAPIGGGLLILLGLGAVYGSKKWYDNRKMTSGN